MTNPVESIFYSEKIKENMFVSHTVLIKHLGSVEKNCILHD